ncbi:MAG: hypothetical protein JSS07_04355 [Proteobacteria bacterium]|nr:hypothetical protein [Pseudomonadota bacterium]
MSTTGSNDDKIRPKICQKTHVTETAIDSHQKQILETQTRALLSQAQASMRSQIIQQQAQINLTQPPLRQVQVFRQPPPQPVQQFPVQLLQQISTQSLRPVQQIPVQPLQQIPVQPLQQIPVQPLQQIPLQQLPEQPLQQIAEDPQSRIEAAKKWYQAGILHLAAVPQNFKAALIAFKTAQMFDNTLPLAEYIKSLEQYCAGYEEGKKQAELEVNQLQLKIAQLEKNAKESEQKTAKLEAKIAQLEKNAKESKQKTAVAKIAEKEQTADSLLERLDKTKNEIEITPPAQEIVEVSQTDKNPAIIYNFDYSPKNNAYNDEELEQIFNPQIGYLS